MYNIRKGSELNKLLGYKGLRSFALIYIGGSANAWGSPEASMHTIKHCLTSEDKIRFVETHTTYFKVRKETQELNEWLELEGPKTQDECIEFLKQRR